MAGVSARERLADDHIAGLRIAGGNRVKAIGCHIFDVEVFTTQPPAICPLKVRQIHTSQVIGVAKQRVAVCDAMVKPAAQQMRYRAELTQRTVACQPPGQTCYNLRPAVSAG